VDEAEPGTPVTYLGDDLTDESAFCAVNCVRNPHLSVLVRRARRPTAAEVWLHPPEELRWFLRRWMNAVSGTVLKSVDRISNETSDAADTGERLGESPFAQEDAI